MPDVVSAPFYGSIFPEVDYYAEITLRGSAARRRCEFIHICHGQCQEKTAASKAECLRVIGEQQASRTLAASAVVREARQNVNRTLCATVAPPP